MNTQSKSKLEVALRAFEAAHKESMNTSVFANGGQDAENAKKVKDLKMAEYTVAMQETTLPLPLTLLVPCESEVESLTRQLKQCKAESDAAQKACAEMRKMLGHILRYPEEGFKVTALLASTDCGKGYYSKEQVKVMLMVLEDIATDDLGRVSGGVKQSAQQALAHAEAIMKEEESKPSAS
jgi:hypothetical protein